MLITGLLPLAALALAVALALRRSGDLGLSVIHGTLGWALGAALATEALSLLRAVAFSPMLLCWSLALGGLALAIFTAGRARPASPAPAGRRIAIADWIAGVLLALIGGATLLIALLSPPNNWDSLTYHLPRIEHWIQDRSLDFYPTAIDRQLLYPNLAEILLLQLRLLSGGDRLDNLLQWLAGAGAVLLVGRIAVALGASRRGAAFARIGAATLPIAILEASSTQNDLVLAFFLLAAAERLLAWRRSRRLGDAAALGLAFGLALATKGTAYVIGLPLGLWFLLEAVAAGRRAAAPLLACALLTLLPNIPFYAQNLAYAAGPLGSLAERTNNAAFGPRALLVNATRDLAVNVATLNEGFDRRVTRLVREGLTRLGLDPDAPALTFEGARFEIVSDQTNEDFAGNPVQLAIAAGAMLAVFLGGRSFYPRRRYGACLLAGALAFAILLRWQPWITRLQLPLFALAAPLAAFLPIDGGRGRATRLATALLALALVAAMIIGAWPALTTGRRRPLLASESIAYSIWTRSPEELVVIARPELLAQYRAAVDEAKRNGDLQIGLLLAANDWEYPLWRMLRPGSGPELRIEHVGRESLFAPGDYPLGPFQPSLIIATIPDRPPALTIDGVLWRRERQLPDLAVYRRQG